MLGALSQKNDQYRVGKYLGEEDDYNIATAPFFTYEEINNVVKRFDQIIQNLQTCQGSVIIRTNYNYKWKTQSRVKLQDGHIYTIIQIEEQENEISPQSSAIITIPCETLYYMELIQASEDEY